MLCPSSVASADGSSLRKTCSVTFQPQSTTGPLHTPATKGNGLKSLLEWIKSRIGSYTNGPSSDAPPTRKSGRDAISPYGRNSSASLQPLPNRTPTAIRNGTKGPLEKIKSRKRGYTGVAQRANAFHVDDVLDHGRCFQCDRQLPKWELQDQSRMYGHVVGICNDCYPEFMQYLQDIADAGLEEFDVGGTFAILKFHKKHTD